MRSKFVLALAVALAAAGGARAGLRQFSYEPADDATRAVSGPVTLLVHQTMLGTRVLKLRSTEGQATADLVRDQPSRMPREADGARAVYGVTSADNGTEFDAAMCPGSKRVWLAMSNVKYGANLGALVLGDDPAGKGVKVCRMLRFYFKGEWALPSGPSPSIEPIGPPDFPK